MKYCQTNMVDIIQLACRRPEKKRIRYKCLPPILLKADNEALKITIARRTYLDVLATSNIRGAIFCQVINSIISVLLRCTTNIDPQKWRGANLIFNISPGVVQRVAIPLNTNKEPTLCTIKYRSLTFLMDLFLLMRGRKDIRLSSIIAQIVTH